MLRPRHTELPPAEPPPQIEVPSPAPDPNAALPHATQQDPGIASIAEMAQPWTSKQFFIRNGLTGENVPGLLIRLPASSASQESGYWAFSMNAPYGNCQLEYVKDLAKLKGKELREARREAAVIFQQIALVKQRSALDNVCAGALGEVPLWRSLTPVSFPREIRERAAVALQRVRMLDHAWQRAATLSGGQAQRVAIARAYCQQASVILADEPVSALDPRAAEEVLDGRRQR